MRAAHAKRLLGLQSATAMTAVAVVVAVLLAGTPSKASAADPTLDRALNIVSTVASGEPLRVVTTQLRASGEPVFSTTVASSRASAVSLVQNALRRGLSVSMAHRATVLKSNDTLRPRQWALDALRAESIWPINTGAYNKRSKNRQARVAVIDTGVAAHPDLQGNLLAGKDFVSARSITDPNGHGTHVAGIIAAAANNKRGIAGIAPGVKILPVRVLDATGSGNTDVIARGIVWAANQGVQVINLSLGTSYRDSALASAVTYAQQKGVLVVAAAGNDGQGGLLFGCSFLLGCPAQYPAALPDVLGVSAINSARQRAAFSSYGRWVDIAAPGEGIVSLVPTASAFEADCAWTQYCTLSGTSMAAPYVAAAAALGYSEKGWKGKTLATKLMQTATDLGQAGWDRDFGVGLVNPLALVKSR